MNVIILAAGMGKRMQSSLPKVLHPLAGKPLLQHVVDTARQLPGARLCIVYGHGSEQILEQFSATGQTVPPLAFAEQSPQLGTGHAVMQAIPFLDNSMPTLVLYGDVPLTTLNTLEQLTRAAGDDKLAVLTATLDDPSGYGRIVREQGSIRRIVEQKDANEAEKNIRETNTGILVAPTVALKRWLSTLSCNNAQKEYYLTDIIASAVQDKVEVVSAAPSALWEVAGINSKAQLAALERQYQQTQAQALLEQGVTLLDPARIDIRGTLICGRDVTIDVNCIFTGTVTLADGVSIGAHCVISNSTLAENVQVKPFTHIEHSTIGAASDVGPFARLRPGTALQEHVHIGNFVETKNASLDAHTKVGHLTYLGDTRIGKRVNIGAGTITCNYDGANKHLTVIGDDAFIGSDTQLVAPVEVEARATIGAGSTITRTAPADQLTVSRSKQLSIRGWVRPVKNKPGNTD